MIEIIPGILEKEWGEIEKKLEMVKLFAKTVHIDVIDGKFAENTTFLDPSPFAAYSKDLWLEVHLMVEEPEQYIEPFAQAGFKRFIGHIEKMTDQASFVAKGELWGEVGLAVDGPTPLEQVKVSFEDLDFLTIMLIKAGFSGQELQQEQLKKCKQLRETSALLLEVDGGVKQSVIKEIVAAGATRLVVNSALFSGDPQQNFVTLQKLAEEGEAAEK